MPYENILRKFFILLACLPGCISGIQAQSCDSNYLSVLYKGRTYNNFIKAQTTPQQDFITIGNLQYHDCWMARFSNNGNPVWCNEYTAVYENNNNHYFSNVTFNDFVMDAAGNSFVAGSLVKHGEFVNGVEIPAPVHAATITKFDIYGTPLWTHVFGSVPGSGPAFNASNIIQLSNNDLVFYLSADQGIRSAAYGKVVCLDGGGNIKWATILTTGPYFAGGNAGSIKRGLRQLKSGIIAVGDVVYKTDPAADNFKITDGEYHFLGMDAASGKIIWETSYQYPSTTDQFVADIDCLTELPNGNLCFFSTLAVSGDAVPTAVNQLVCITTDKTGHIISMTGYYPQGASCSFTDVRDEGGGNTRFLLTDENNRSIITTIGSDGQVQNSLAYGNTTDGYAAACFAGSTKGDGIFMSIPLGLKIQALFTAPDGTIACAMLPVQMQRQTVIWSYSAYAVYIDHDAGDNELVIPSTVVLTPDVYALTRQVDCQRQIACCTQSLVSSRELSLCEGSTYTLPDQTVVKDSGNYTELFKTAQGCDSLSKLHVSLVPQPAKLRASNDTCLGGSASIVLHASGGFPAYNWMNQVIPDSAYTISKAGTYWVNVRNTCGSKTDSIHVFADCSFPFDMPSAFTPNGDGLNDVYRIPPANNNLLVHLTIFNRWGQIVFQTSDKSKGWDGNINGIPQQMDTFIYVAEMKGLNNEKFSRTGTFVLIR